MTGSAVEGDHRNDPVEDRRRDTVDQIRPRSEGRAAGATGIPIPVFVGTYAQQAVAKSTTSERVGCVMWMTCSVVLR